MEKNYTKFSAPGLTGVIVKTGSDCVFDPVSLLALPDTPGCCCKQGNSVQAGINGRFFVKRYSHRTLWNSFRYRFKSPRPDHCLRAAEKLISAGIETPQVLAVLRQSKGRFPLADYLITEDISGEAVFANKMHLTRQMAAEICCFLAKMHDAGIEHGDLNLRNLYQKQDGTWGVIDLDGCRVYAAPLPLGRRRRELARLASSFIKIHRRQAEPGDLPPDIAGFISAEYQKFSTIALDSFRYRNRVKYLAGRKRK